MKKTYTSLALHSSIGIGGQGLIYECTSEKDLLRHIASLQQSKQRIVVLGGGTNILFEDDPTGTIFIKPAISFIAQKGTRLSVGAGINMAALLDFTIHAGLSGLEWAGGLPGTVGGAVRGNAGAFGGEIQNSIEAVRSIIPRASSPCVRERTREECHFAYRSSIFKERSAKDEIITEIVFHLKTGQPNAIHAAIEEKKQYRSKRHPLEHPNIGSIFKNVPLKHVPMEQRRLFAQYIKTDPFPVIPAAVFIQQSGCVGMREGDALVSPKHANFIVNDGSASSKDMKKLVRRVYRVVYNTYKVRLQKEIVVL